MKRQYPETHPIWGLIRLGMLLVFGTVVLYLNASNFDETEIKSIAQILALMSGAEYFIKKI